MRKSSAEGATIISVDMDVEQGFLLTVILLEFLHTCCTKLRLNFTCM